MTVADVDGFLNAFAAASEAVQVYFRWRPQTLDPGDEMVMEAAINGNADALVTFSLRHLFKAGARFGLTVCGPAEALRRIRP